MSINPYIKSEYYRIKAILQEKTPTRMDLFRMMQEPHYILCTEKAKENIFKHYLDALEELDELHPAELELKNSIGGEFLHVLETTLMQKSYKMVLLKAFLQDGTIRMAVTEQNVLKVWKDFFAEEEHWKDLGVESYQEFLKITDEQHLANARKNPIRFLLSSGKGFFIKKPGYALALSEDLKNAVKSEAFCKHFADITEYRIHEYFRKRTITP